MTRELSVVLLLCFPSPVLAKNVALQDRPQLTELCAADEPGEKVSFWGRVLDYQGRPLAKAAVVASPARRERARNDPVIAIVALVKDRDGTLSFQQDIRLESN